MFEEEIKRGVELLNTHGPADWLTLINLETFDIRDATFCVLGQVYSDKGDDVAYCVGLEALGISLNNAEARECECGFDLDYGHMGVLGIDPADGWHTLQDEWLQFLKASR